MRRRKLLRLVLLALCLFVFSCKRGCKKQGITIAVIPKGTSHEFWKAVHAGADKAAKELGVEVAWQGPMQEDDLKQQMEIVQQFVAQGVQGIVLAPLNDKALEKPVVDAKNSGIPTVIFDSSLQGSDYVSFVATDNVAAGKIAGEEMARLLGDKGNVVVLRYQEGSASTHDREEGFLQAIKAHPGITVVTDNQYGGATVESAKAKAENVLASQKAGDGNVQGVFAPNESTTFGVLLAMRSAGLGGKLRFLGFDSSDKLVEALRAGEIDGLVLQDPFTMGYLAVKTMVESLQGKKVEGRIDTGAKLLTKGNVDSAEMQALLAPH